MAQPPNHLPGSDPFASVWEEEVLDDYLKLFRRTYNFLRERKTFPFLAYGTLLGCRRNNQIIPWDGDIDLCVDRGAYEKIHRDLVSFCTQNRCSIVEDGPANYKIFSIDSQRTGRHFNWPWIDIDFWTRRKGPEGNDWISFLLNSGSVFSEHPEDDVFPLREARFEEIQCYIPAKTDNLLNTWYPNWSKQFQSGKVFHRYAGTTRENNPTITRPIE